MKLSKSLKVAITAMIVGGGYAGAAHAIAGELYDKGGYSEVLSFQGEWIFMAFLAIGIALSVRWFWKLKFRWVVNK